MSANCPGCGQPLVPTAKFCASCGAPAPAQSGDPLVGAVLGNYRVIRALAAGGMGQVYIGEQTNLGRKVCIKTLKPELLGDPTIVARFEREAKAVSALKHPNIAQVIDFGKAGQHLYIVMELVDGGSLRSFIDANAPVPLERACNVMLQILSALEEAHAAGIVHRDLKPENALLASLRDGSELVKVVDFGIAKLMDEQQQQGKNLTGTGLVCGTPGYMSPEQIAGEQLDQRTDVYAAGIIFYELLTGKRPFDAPSLPELMRATLTQDPPAPSKLVPIPIPAEADQLLLHCVSREKDLRMTSALDFKRAVELLRPGGRLTSSKALTAFGLKTCTKCQTQNPESQKFCGQCGAPLGATDPQLDALKSVLPASLVDSVASLPTAVEAERKNATIIFADIEGFTALAEKQSPEAVRQLMNRCFDGMSEAVARYDGTVDKFIGEAMMVLFGVPRAHEDDPERAVRCALDMQHYLDEVNKTIAQPLRMRVGICSGQVVTGGIGGSRRMDFTVVGDAVTTAQRLQEHAQYGKILVNAAVRRLTDRAIKFRQLPPMPVRGVVEPLAVFEVEGLQVGKVSLEPFVGRRDELSKLDGLIRQVRSGKPGGVLILGEPGLGKTRLLEEARRLGEEAGLKVTVARARRMVSAGELELLREAVFGLVGGLPPSEREADARLDGLSQLGAGFGDLQRLKHLFGSAPPLPGYDKEDARRLDMATVTQTLLTAAKVSRGLLVLLDDAHLGDRSSLEYFDELISRAAGAPLGLIATARPGESDKLMRRMPRHELRSMDAADVLQVAKNQLDGGHLPESVAATLMQRSEGNPFVAREIIRTLIDASALELRGGQWATSSTLHSITLPESVGQLIAARLDAVSPGARQFMRYGAVHGRTFPMELVAQAMEGTQVDVQQSMGECRNRGFLVHVDQPQGCMQFRQELVHQTVLKSIAEADLRHIHSRLGDALELGLSSGDGHPADAMARHFLAAGRTRKAATYFSVSAERLAARSAFMPAVDAYTKAVQLTYDELTRTQNAQPDAWRQVITLACKAAPVQSLLAPADALKTLSTMIDKAPRTLDAPTKAHALHQRGVLELKLGKATEAAATLAEAVRLWGPDANFELKAQLEVDLASAREALGDYGGATQLLLEALKRIAARKLTDKDLMWRTLNQLGRIHLRIGQADRSREFFENAQAQAKRAQSTVGEVKAMTNLASAFGSVGNTGRAEQLLQQAKDLASKDGDRVDVARIEYNLGRLYLSSARLDEATRHLQLAVELSNQVGWREGAAAAAQALDGMAAQGVAGTLPKAAAQQAPRPSAPSTGALAPTGVVQRPAAASPPAAGPRLQAVPPPSAPRSQGAPIADTVVTPVRKS